MAHLDPTRLRALLSDHPPQAYFQREQGAIRDVWDAAREMLALLHPEPPRGCRAKLAKGQWWAFCGETDMGQGPPALCEECGGEFKRADTNTSPATKE